MTSIVVLTATGRRIEGIDGAVAVEALSAASALASVMSRYDAAVLVSDGFDAGQAVSLAAAIADVARLVIEVRSTRWDGETSSPISAACRGVISGFGDAGVAAAVRLLQSVAP